MNEPWKKKEFPKKNVFTSEKLSTKKMKVRKWKKFSFGGALSWLMGAVTLLVISVVAGAGFYIFTVFQPMSPSSTELIEVVIPMDSSTSAITEILQEHKLVKNEKIFYYYLRVKKVTGLQAGTYHLSPAVKPIDIVSQLKSGKVFDKSIKFTIPEGLTVLQIANKLAKEKIVDKEVFLDVVNNETFEDIAIVKEIPESKERVYRLEGFLFPKTYEVHEEATEVDIVRAMLKQTEKEVKPEWVKQAAKGKLSMYEIFTLASIIEREVAADKEHEQVAGVYHNRLKKDMLLQADATIQFALGEQKERLMNSDLTLDDPYNSYKHKGLPPSPIASPGSKAIRAAIYPKTHDYLFYVTKKDGTGEHYFSKTYEGHLNNISKSKKNQ